MQTRWMKPKSSKKRVHIPWDDAFKQLMRDILSTLGLQVLEEPKLGKLPLKADLVIISRKGSSGKWRNHPLWQHFSQRNLLEFKSINDPLLPGDFEVLLAYTLLYRVKFKIGYDTRLSSWLVVPKRILLCWCSSLYQVTNLCTHCLASSRLPKPLGGHFGQCLSRRR